MQEQHQEMASLARDYLLGVVKRAMNVVGDYTSMNRSDGAFVHRVGRITVTTTWDY